MATGKAGTGAGRMQRYRVVEAITLGEVRKVVMRVKIKSGVNSVESEMVKSRK